LIPASSSTAFRAQAALYLTSKRRRRWPVLVVIAALTLNLLVPLPPQPIAATSQSGWNWYKTDTHVHGAISGDGLDDMGIIAQAGQARGYDAMFLTDHQAGSNFPISTVIANHVVFDDDLGTKWEPDTFGSLSTNVLELVTNPVSTGTKSLHLKGTSASSGETFVVIKRGPNLRSGNDILKFSVRPTTIGAGSGLYVSVSLGGDPTVQGPEGYTTQDGGEINVVVTGINVGAQPYWNAEATMLMHTKGILVMTPDSAMVLTGKQSLDYSGGVSAEDNFGIGGYDRIMGPNGQAQYWAPDLSKAIDVLLAHYAHTYTAPGERFPRPAPTTDPADRDIRSAPHSGPGCDFTRLGEIFDPATNGERKKPFDIRSVLRGVADADHPPLERWADMHDAESVVVFDAHLGGQPIALIGIESRPLPRHGPSPVDGPTQWTAGTLFPRSSKKTARAINAASGNRPLVVLANLSGFDGSPESLRGLQLEYGSEIGRAVVNFDGPIVFCVVSRYHGGAFVVFSGTLNDNMEIAAVEGSYASVIGGAPAAAVVFAGEVNKRTAADPRVADLEAEIAEASGSGQEADATRLRAELASARAAVRSEKLGQVADEFDNQHSIERARSMGSVHTIVPAIRLRPYLADAVQRGIAHTLNHDTPTTG